MPAHRFWETSGNAQPTSKPILDAYPANGSFYIKCKKFGYAGALPGDATTFFRVVER